MSDLKIDWSWMKSGQKNSPDKEMTETFKENLQEIKLHELLVQEREQRKRNLQNTIATSEEESEEDDSAESKQKIWERLKNLNRERKHGGKLFEDLENPKIISEHRRILEIPFDAPVMHFSSEEAGRLLKSSPQDSDPTPFEPNKLTLDHQVLVRKFGFFPMGDDGTELLDNPDLEDVSEAAMDFSATERVILDYQTGVLYLAVGSVFIFFAVALCYSIKHVRNWGSRNYVQGKF